MNQTWERSLTEAEDMVATTRRLIGMMKNVPDSTKLSQLIDRMYNEAERLESYILKKAHEEAC